MIENLISTIRQFINLDLDEVEKIKILWKEKSLKKGDYFLEEGKICREVGFITKGVMRYYINQEGEEKTFEFAQENDFICNYESFIPQVPSKKTIQALEDCDILKISYNDLQTFYNSFHEGERFGRLVIEQVFIGTLRDLSSLYTDTPEQRYEKFLEEHTDLQQRISQYYIASYVGIKPQSLSRIRKRISGLK